MPVTVVRIPDDEEATVVDDIANALTPADVTVHYHQPDRSPAPVDRRPVVVGVDGSDTSRHALAFAIGEAALYGTPLHVLFCWQQRDLGQVPGYENAVPPTEVCQRRAEQIVEDMVAAAPVPTSVTVQAHAFHIPASKGLIAASRYASHLIVGSRGLTGLDAHFLGSVSKQIVNFAECTVTVVH